PPRGVIICHRPGRAPCVGRGSRGRGCETAESLNNIGFYRHFSAFLVIRAPKSREKTIRGSQKADPESAFLGFLRRRDAFRRRKDELCQRAIAAAIFATWRPRTIEHIANFCQAQIWPSAVARRCRPADTGEHKNRSVSRADQGRRPPLCSLRGRKVQRRGARRNIRGPV